MDDEPWTIAELAERAAGALTAAPSVVRSRRIREAPNERLIRWYATVGLVDPPLSRRGRVALYGRRHLLQLVAVKRRQAEGRSLAEIQAELAGAPDKQLEAIAQVAAHPSDGQKADPDPPARFWTRPAAEPLAEPSAEPSAPTEPQREPGAWPHGYPADQPLGIRVAPGVILLIEDPAASLGPDDLAAVRQAARPLLSALTRLGLTSQPPAAAAKAAERKPT